MRAGRSAAEFYYRAALYYGPACGVIHANTPRKIELYQRLVHCNQHFTELFDELCPLEDGERLFEMLKCPKDLWVYENETHTFGGRLPDFYLHVAD